MSSPSRRDMDETWTSGRDMAISRTKIGERSSISPGDYDSIRALISISRPDEVDNDQICPMSRSFSVDLRWFGLVEGISEEGFGVVKSPNKELRYILGIGARGGQRVHQRERGQRSPLF